MLNAVDKNQKFLPFVAAAASFSASITGIFFRFSRLGISTGRLKSPKLNPLESLHVTFGYCILSSPATFKSEESDAEVQVLSLLLESAMFTFTHV